MQARRVLPLLGVVLTTSAVASFISACGGDDKTVYIYVEAGTDAGQIREGGTQVVPGDDDDDAGGSTCQPGAATPFTFKPATTGQNKCTDDDINSLLDACIFTGMNADCQAAAALAQDCFSCMIGTPQDTTGHPLEVYDSNTDPEVIVASTGACMAALTGEGTSQTDCTFAFGEVETCAYEACVPQCLTISDPTTFQACLSASISTVCTAGVTTFTSTKCQGVYGSTTVPPAAKYGFCLNSDLPDGGTLTNGDYYFRLVQLVCGAPQTDAGTADSGTPDSGVDSGTDAGNDAGLDAGADADAAL